MQCSSPHAIKEKEPGKRKGSSMGDPLCLPVVQVWQLRDARTKPTLDSPACHLWKRNDELLSLCAFFFCCRYGSYEMPNDPDFRSTRLSLVDRGFTFAIAHVRGGGTLWRSALCCSGCGAVRCAAVAVAPWSLHCVAAAAWCSAGLVGGWRWGSVCVCAVPWRLHLSSRCLRTPEVRNSWS